VAAFIRPDSLEIPIMNKSLPPMPDPSCGVLPTRFVSPEQTAQLKAALELTPEELALVAGGVRASGCCTPDGGTCCPNKKVVARS
jgi:hypothetical protein